MLSGEFRHNVDAKNRVFIPAKHRDELGPYLMIARSSRESCLRVYSRDAWDAYCLKVMSKLDGEDSEKVMRYLNRNAASVEPDAQGRITIPQSLLSHACINSEHREAVIVGCGEFSEIWEAKNYDALVEFEDSAMISSLLSKKGL